MVKGIRSHANETGFGAELYFLTDPGMTPSRLRSILVVQSIKGVIIAA